MSRFVSVETTEFRDFILKLDKAAKGEFKKELNLFLEGLGDEFLRIIQDEIISRKTVDTRLLLASFMKGKSNNVYALKENDLSLEIGTNVEYAAYVNDGHWLNPQGVETRWVPGVWKGDIFEYTPGAKTGMLLKQKFIPGSHYWDAALKIIEKMIPHLLEAKMQQWLNNYFG